MFYEKMGKLFLSALLLTPSSGFSQFSSFLNVFPNSSAVVQGNVGYTIDTTVTNFSNSSWCCNWDEANVFRAELQHQNYSLRIGEGSQMYSIQTPIGEICPPQNSAHAWIDDTWLNTCYFNELDDTMQYVQANYSSNQDWFKPFVHSCGVYGHQDPIGSLPPDWWAPRLAEHWDQADNSYSVLTLGFQSNAPSYPRGDMLFYQKIKDLGDGAFEMTYMTFYFNTSFNPDENYLTHFSPWGGVRTTALPEQLSSNPNGSWYVNNTFHGQSASTENAGSTGGYGVFTKTNSNPNSYALGYVYGTSNQADYIHGYAGGNPASGQLDTLQNGRNFTVAASRFVRPLPPGKPFFYRIYFVLGERDSVINRCVNLAPEVEYGSIDIQQADGNLKPIYLSNLNGQEVISDTGECIAGYVFSNPVENSKPLLLVRNSNTGEYHATTDPYLTMPKYPIPGTPYEGWIPYDGTTEIIKLLGFVMPNAEIDNSHNYIPLEGTLTDQSYYTQNGIYDVGLMIVEPPICTFGLNSFDSDFIKVYPNPSKGDITINFNDSQLGGMVSLKLQDALGRVVKVKTLINSTGAVTIDCQDLELGSYNLLINFRDNSFAKKVIIL